MSPKEYIVERVSPMIDKETNQQRADNYGNLKYYVKFQGEADTVPLSAKKPPVVGDKKFGSIEQGQYGRYFKAAKNPNGFSGGGSKYDSDGQKQGMAIKSAADYVTKHSKDKLAPNEFARAVEAYATALYNLELKKHAPAPAGKAWESMRAKSEEVKERVAAEEELGKAVANMVDSGMAISEEELAAIPF